MRVGIIGAGILGASAAYHLAKAGVEVVLVDRNDKGKATNASAGIICPWLSQRRNKKWYELVKNGARFYPTFVDELHALGVDHTGYDQIGVLSVHTDQKKLEKMKERALAKKEDAPEIGDIELVSAREAKTFFPLLADHYHGLYVSGAARVDGKKVCRAFIEGAVHYGAKYILGDASIVTNGRSIKGIKVNNHEELYCDRVVVTAGAWAKQVLQPLHLTFQVNPQRAQIILLKIKDNANNWPVVLTPTSKYLLGFEGGQIVAGSTYEETTNFETTTSVRGLHEILNVVSDIAPQLLEGDLLDAKVGFRPVVPDFLPVFGEVKQYKGLFIGNGLGATGLTAGPLLGAEIAALVLGKETILQLNDYDVNRLIEEN